jgi:hypothetical protein
LISKEPQRVLELDQAERQREKQASRDRDARRLASGEVSREQLSRENSFAGGISNTEITHIGGRPIKPRPVK